MTTTAERNAEAFRRLIERGPNLGDLSVIDDVVAPDCSYHVPVSPEPLRGAEAVKQLISGFRAAFPDLHVTIDELIADGDIVVARVTATGTHEGELLGHPATSRTASWTVVHWAHFSDGLLIEDRVTFDVRGLLTQLGLSAAQPVPAS